MARLRIITGPAGSGKTALVMGDIARAVEGKEPGQLLLIPEQYSHEAEKELCRVCGDSLSLYGEVLSFTRLAAAVEEELGLRRELLDKGGRLLAMKLALSDLEGRLRIFAAAGRRPELITGLLGLVTELKTDAISPEALEAAATEEGGPLGDKLRELALILGAYDAVTARGRAESADRLTVLCRELPRSALGARGHIYIDGFSDFTAQELGVIAALLDKGADMTVCLSCDDPARGLEIFDAQRKTALRLRQLGQARGREPEALHLAPKRGQNAPALAFLETELFSYGLAHCADRGNAVELRIAPDEASECALAAARCLQLVRETGCRWRDIAVAVRGFEDYARSLESIFAYYGVPLYLGRRSAVGEQPVTRMLKAAFEVLSGGWECTAVLSWLKTGLCGAQPEELDELENYALQWALRGEIWSREAPWSLSPGGFEAPEGEAAAEKLAALDALRKRLIAPLAVYDAASGQAETARAQGEAFAAFLGNLGLGATLETRARALEARGLGAAASEHAQLWEILVSALEQLVAMLGDMPMEREEFFRLYPAMLEQYDVGTIPAALDAVSGGEMDRMRRRHLKHLIVLGASDARLPAPEKGDPLLSPEERERLVLRGLGISSPRGDALYRELELVYSCLTLPSETLMMSYPLGGGGEGRPSVIFSRLALLTGKSPEPWDRETAMACAAAPALELAAQEGALSRYARDYFAGTPEGRERLEKLRRGRELGRGRLSRESVRTLYGETPRVSATRAESYAQCGYAYFLKYGLRARERKRADFDPPELGKFMHYVLENVTRDVQREGGFARLREQRRDALVNQYIDRYIREVLGDFKDKSQRFVYLFRRLGTTVRRVVADMAAELAAGDFQPLDFELDLSGEESLLRDGECSVALTGVADRVDGWIQGEKLYLRVMDYKTGKKAFSLSDVWYGMGLQMLMYLFTLEKLGAKRYGREIVPAGVLYVPARDVLIRAKSSLSGEEILEAKAKELRRSGLLLRSEAVLEAMEHGKQPRFIPVKFNKEGEPAGDSLASLEQLGQLSAHIEKTLLAIARELRSGDIPASPASGGGTDACQYCPYGEICRFEEGRDQRRWQTRLKAPEVWGRLDAGEKKEAEKP